MAKIYKCDYINSGINFERNGVYACCKTAHKGGGMPVLAETYADFDWQRILELKKNWRAQIAVGNPPEKCVGCPHIVEDDGIVAQDDFSIYFIDVNSFVNCNSKCVYCDCWSNTFFKETSLLPRFQQMFDKGLLKDSKHGYIQFAGGEPALMKDFETIVNLCIDNGISRYIVNSNGIKYSKGIERLLSEAKVNLCVSLDSGCSETYQKVKQVPCFDKVVKNLEQYAKAQKGGQSKVWSKFIIIPDINDSEEEIIKWYDLSLKLGVKALVLDVEREWFKHNNRKITSEMEKMISIIQKKCQKDNIELTYYESLKCLYGIH